MHQHTYSIEVISTCKRCLNASILEEVFVQAKKKQLRKLVNSVKIDGFRPGKVPEALVQELYKEHIHSKALIEVLQSSFDQAVHDAGIEPVTAPAFERVNAEMQGPVEYMAQFEIYPDVPCPKLSGVMGEKLTVLIKPSDVDYAVERIRRQQAKWQPVSRPAGYGDRVSFSYNFSQQIYEEHIILEEGYLAYLIDKFKNTQSGVEVMVALPIPGTEEPIPTVCTVQLVEEGVLPELDEEFVQQFGEKDIDTFRSRVERDMQRYLDQALPGRVKTQVIKHLLFQNPIEELPSILLDREYQRLEENLRSRLNFSEAKESVLPEAAKKALRNIARRQVTLGLIYKSFSKKQALKLDNALLKDRISDLIDKVGARGINPSHFHSDGVFLQHMREQILEEQILNKLSEQIQWHEKTVDYISFMQEESSIT